MGQEKILEAMNEISLQMLEEAQAHKAKFERANMSGNLAWAAAVQCSLSTLVGLELLRLKALLPEVDLNKLSDHVEEIREKVARAMQQAIVDVANKYRCQIATVRNVEFNDYLGEDFKWPGYGRRKK